MTRRSFFGLIAAVIVQRQQVVSPSIFDEIYVHKTTGLMRAIVHHQHGHIQALETEKLLSVIRRHMPGLLKAMVVNHD